MNSYTEKKKEYNHGLGMLKIWMAFEVVYLHTGGPFSIWMISAVPVFMTLSFLLATRGLIADPIRRLKRLVIPYLFWCVTNYIVLGIMGMLIPDMPAPTLRGFISQIVCGTSDNDAGQLWFLNNLILLSLLVLLLYRAFGKKSAMIMMTVLGVLCVIYENTGMDFTIQGRVNTDPNAWFLTGLVMLPEMIPFAALGLILFETGVLTLLEKKRYLSIATATVFTASWIVCFIIEKLFKDTGKRLVT